MEALSTIAACAVLLGCALFLLGLLAAWRRRRGTLQLCPGPRGRWWWPCIPTRWFVVHACRYNLTGLTADASGTVRCPECGRTVASKDILHHSQRFRPLSLGITLFTCGAITLQIIYGHVQSVPRMMPATALVMFETALAEETPPAYRRELRDRSANKKLNNWQTQRLIDICIRRLRDDDIRNNAGNAIYQLTQIGAAAVPALERALDSEDWQQRQLAAHILRQDRMYVPSDRMLQVTIEGLRDDHFPWNPGGITWVMNARDGRRFLSLHARMAEDMLLKGLDSDDMQQRVLCAAALAHARRLHLIDQFAPVLIDHLRDNDTRRDARHATDALLALGPEAIPWLEQHRNTQDAQQQRSIRWILSRLSEY